MKFVKISFVVVFFLFAPLLLLGTTINGYLPMTVDWSTGSYTKTVEFNEENENYKIGSIQIAESKIPIKFLKGPNPLLIIDSNVDGCFEDNGPSEMYLRETKQSQDLRFWNAKVPVIYIENGEKIEKEIFLRFVASKYGVYGDFHLEYWISSHQEGVLYFDDKEYKISLFTSRSDGDYSNLSDIHFGIDRNNDGRIELTVLSPEVYSQENIININGTNFEIDSISKSGGLISLSSVNEEATYKPFLNTGDEAPAFITQDFLGNRVELPEEIITILILSPDLINDYENSDCNCSECNIDNFRLGEIIELPEKWSAFKSEKTRIIWLLSNDEYTENCFEERKNVFVIHDEEILNIYGYKNAERVFVIDSLGIIKATDEYWFDEESMFSNHPQAGQLMMCTEDIKMLLLELY